MKEYKEKFPEVFDAIHKCGGKSGRDGPAVNKLKDLCGSEDIRAVNRVLEILSWLESLPISSLPYVEMGFDALDPKIIASLNNHRQNVKENFNSIKLQVKQTEILKPWQFLAERFPYWTSPFGPRTA